MSELPWCHVIVTTYGSWLPGDPRGFRTRRHKLHVDGDYKSPPPAGEFDIHRRSREQMKFPQTILLPQHRPVIGEAMRIRLEADGSRVVSLAVAATHVHLQCRLPAGEEWTWIGNAKRKAWYEWSAVAGNVKLWGKKGKREPIKDRGHQQNVYHYICRHEDEGACVWKYTDAD